MLLLLVLLAQSGGGAAAHWEHAVQMDANYLLQWSPGAEDITFELQVRTLGYVGFGFSRDGRMAGADLLVGWLSAGNAFLQDRHAGSRGPPLLDESQDYELLLAYQNGSHTVLRFRRRYDTCDPKDFRLTGDTTRLLFAYHGEPPSTAAGPLLYHGSERRGFRSLYLMERTDQQRQAGLHVWTLRNPKVNVPPGEDTFTWCKVFRLPKLLSKQHIVRWEPLLEQVVHRVTLFECQGEGDLAAHARQPGQECSQPNMAASFYNCSGVVLSWAPGSQGFAFPKDVGYPLDASTTRYFLMQTQYSASDGNVADQSGLRLFYTAAPRRHDAGVLSVGLEPSWRHIIPPGQPEVLSEGHCVPECTRQTLPAQGVTVFAVAMHTRMLGRKVRLRHIRNGVELPPIAADANYDASYQEYRSLKTPVVLYPGDQLIAECVYDSRPRSSITLGGATAREELCQVLLLYYPRGALSVCHSLPSLATVLGSLGVHQLQPGSNPVRIKLPLELAGMTLEKRLMTYDWDANYRNFQEATRRGTFKPLCWLRSPQLLPGTEDLESSYPNISQIYTEISTCWKKPRRWKKPGEEPEDASLLEFSTQNGCWKMGRCGHLLLAMLSAALFWR